MTTEVYFPSTQPSITTSLTQETTTDEKYENTVSQTFHTSLDKLNSILSTIDPSSLLRQTSIDESLYITEIQKGLYETDISDIKKFTEDQITSEIPDDIVSYSHLNSTDFIANGAQEHEIEVMTEAPLTQFNVPVKQFQDSSEHSPQQKPSTTETDTPTSPFLTVTVQVNTDIIFCYNIGTIILSICLQIYQFFHIFFCTP